MRIRFARAVALACALAATAFGSPLAAAPFIVSASHFTDRFAPNAVPGLPTGDKVQVTISIAGGSTSDPFPSITAVALQGATSIPLTFFPNTAPIIIDPVYLAFIDFNAALTGSWTVTATDSAGTSAAVLTPAIGNPQFVPFVTGISVSDASLTPTVMWSVPDLTGFDIEQTRIRIIEAATGLQIFQTPLALAATSFDVPAGLLLPGVDYVYRISLEDLESDTFGLHVENRSNAFSSIARAPEPATLALVIAAAALLPAFFRRGRASARAPR
jgi:hypothetical protein